MPSKVPCKVVIAFGATIAPDRDQQTLVLDAAAILGQLPVPTTITPFFTERPGDIFNETCRADVHGRPPHRIAREQFCAKCELQALDATEGTAIKDTGGKPKAVSSF